MADNAVALVSIFCVMVCIVLGAYVYCLYKIIKAPAHLLDVDALWAGLYDPVDRDKPHYSAWCLFIIGELLSFTGLISHISFLLIEPELISEAYCILYSIYFTSLLFWPILAIYGHTYYLQTLFGLFLTAASSCGLFIASIYTWGVHDARAWLLFPLFLHTTFTDFLFWGCTWSPKNITSFSEIQATNVKPKERDPVFVIEEV